MTLKKLRGKCLLEIGDLNPVLLMPDLNAEVRHAIRSVTRYLGGIERNTTFDTEADVREYSLPSDFISIEYVINDTDNIRLREITLKQRSEIGTGTPTAYYLRANKMGFNLIPDGIVTIREFYKGYGDDVTEDSDEVLPEYSLADDDSLWDAVKFSFAYKYWLRKIAQAENKGDKNAILIAQNAANRNEKIALQKRHEFAIQWDKRNMDEAVKVTLPSAYFKTDIYSTIDEEDWI